MTISQQLIATLKKARRGWLRFTGIFFAVTIPFAAFRIATGAAEPIALRELAYLLPPVFPATFAGAVAYALTERVRTRPSGYYLSWAIAGAVTGLVFIVIGAAVVTAGGADPIGPAVVVAVIGAGIVVLCAITGVYYGWEAKRMGWASVENNPPSEDQSTTTRRSE